MQNKTEIKFLDVGCKIGGSFSIAKKYGFTFEQGIGIDVNAAHVENFKKSGYNGIVASATNIPFPDKHFELVIFSHVLEHLPNEEEGYKALRECLRVCSKTLFVALPFFDEDEYLNSIGFKTCYSDWKQHTNKVHLSSLKKFFENYNYTVKMVKKIDNSSFDEILPLEGPADVTKYDAEKHPSKKTISFEKNVWREYHLIVNLNG